MIHDFSDGGWGRGQGREATQSGEQPICVLKKIARDNPPRTLSKSAHFIIIAHA